MSFLDWLFGKKHAPAEEPGNTPAKIGNYIFDAALQAATTSLDACATNERLGHFVKVAQMMPDSLLLTVLAAALPLAVQASSGCSERVQETFIRTFLERVRSYFNQYAPGVPENAFVNAQHYLLEQKSTGQSDDVLAGVWLMHQLKRAELTIEEVQESGLFGAALAIHASQWFKLKMERQL